MPRRRPRCSPSSTTRTGWTRPRRRRCRSVPAVSAPGAWLAEARRPPLPPPPRRLQAERVALLFAARDGEAYGFDVPDLPTVVLGGVAGAAAHAGLSARAGGPVDLAVCDRLVAGTGGNPLALGELAGAL